MTAAQYSSKPALKEMDDDFWKSHYPPLAWNCRCTTYQLAIDEPITPTDKIPHVQIPKMFAVNLAEHGLVFPKGSSYYIGCPKEILKESEKLLFKTNQKATIQRLVHGKISIDREELSKPITFTVTGIKEAFNQPHKQYEEKNTLLLSIENVLKDAEYKGFKEKFPDNKMVKGSHIFEFNIGTKKSYVIVKELITGENHFYSISDSKNVLIDIKRKSG